MRALVVPTNREDAIKEFLYAWELDKDWDITIVVEDRPAKSMDLDVEHHYSWAEINEDLGQDSWIISNQDSAIRCYGFLKAYRLGADYIFSLDDDCHPCTLPWCQGHIDRLTCTPRWTESILGQRTRGLPYDNQGVLDDVMINVGFWTDVPDLDSIQSIGQPSNTCFKPPEYDRIIPNGQYAPMCGMNFAFKRAATPLCYFPLMGLSSPYSRFDDIWCGIIAKKICDHLGWHISMGKPFIKHTRLSNKFDNLVKEAPGIKFNEEFWEIIDKIELTTNTPHECMRELGNKMDHASLYVAQLGLAIRVWADLFS